MAHVGLTRSPFGKSILAKDLFIRDAYAEAVARISFCVMESALGVITGDVGADKTVAVRVDDRVIGPPEILPGDESQSPWRWRRHPTRSID